MAGTVTFQQLIDQVKKELTPQFDEPENPLFLVEKIEIQVAVKISSEGKGGVNLQIVELGGGISKENSNIITVSLTPIIPPEQLRQLLDSATKRQVTKESTRRLIKGAEGNIPGIPE